MNINGTSQIEMMTFPPFRYLPEGRHIAGSRLDDIQYEDLFIPENGFNENAVYRDDYLNNSFENGYLGMSSVYKKDTDNPLIDVSDNSSDPIISFNVEFFDGVDTNEKSFDGKQVQVHLFITSNLMMFGIPH